MVPKANPWFTREIISDDTGTPFRSDRISNSKFRNFTRNYINPRLNIENKTKTSPARLFSFSDVEADSVRNFEFASVLQICSTEQHTTRITNNSSTVYNSKDNNNISFCIKKRPVTRNTYM